MDAINLTLKECDICCEEKSHFVSCLECIKDVCWECSWNIQENSLKCPFCREEYPIRAMEHAIITGNIQHVQRLLDGGFDPKFIIKQPTEHNHPMSLLNYANEYSQMAIIALLESCGARNEPHTIQTPPRTETRRKRRRSGRDRGRREIAPDSEREESPIWFTFRFRV